MTEEKNISEIDKKVVRALQGEFPLVAEPYKELAARCGISEKLFLERVESERWGLFFAIERSALRPMSSLLGKFR